MSPFGIFKCCNLSLPRLVVKFTHRTSEQVQPFETSNRILGRLRICNYCFSTLAGMLREMHIWCSDRFCLVLKCQTSKFNNFIKSTKNNELNSVGDYRCSVTFLVVDVGINFNPRSTKNESKPSFVQLTSPRLNSVLKKMNGKWNKGRVCEGGCWKRMKQPNISPLNGLPIPPEVNPIPHFAPVE